MFKHSDLQAIYHVNKYWCQYSTWTKYWHTILNTILCFSSDI